MDRVAIAAREHLQVDMTPSAQTRRGVARALNMSPCALIRMDEVSPVRQSLTIDRMQPRGTRRDWQSRAARSSLARRSVLDRWKRFDQLLVAQRFQRRPRRADLRTQARHFALEEQRVTAGGPYVTNPPLTPEFVWHAPHDVAPQIVHPRTPPAPRTLMAQRPLVPDPCHSCLRLRGGGTLQVGRARAHDRSSNHVGSSTEAGLPGCPSAKENLRAVCDARPMDAYRLRIVPVPASQRPASDAVPRASAQPRGRAAGADRLLVLGDLERTASRRARSSAKRERSPRMSKGARRRSAARAPAASQSL